jgi:hypothetical protein
VATSPSWKVTVSWRVSVSTAEMVPLLPLKTPLFAAVGVVADLLDAVAEPERGPAVVVLGVGSENSVRCRDLGLRWRRARDSTLV